MPVCEIPGPVEGVADPVSVPEMPQDVSRTDSTATFDRDGVVRLTQVRVAAETNKRIAEENAAALRARNEEVEALIECARYSRIWMEVREEMLEQERRDHFIDNIWHRAVIVLGAVAVAL